jgi:hypothetical protein
MVAETANGCLVLHNARTIAERHNRAPKNLKRLLYALLLSASGELLPSRQRLIMEVGNPYLIVLPQSDPDAILEVTKRSTSPVRRFLKLGRG